MMQKIVAIGLFLVFIVVALAAVPSFIDWNAYKPFIAARVRAQTGFTLTLGGTLDLRLLPTPHAVLTNVSLTPPGAGLPLISVDRADVQVALLPLLTGKIVVDSIALMRPQVSLQVDDSGRANWLTPQLQGKLGTPMGGGNVGGSGGGTRANRVALREIYIRDGAVNYADRRQHRTLALTDVDLTVHGDGLYGPYEAEGTVTYGGKPLRLTLGAKNYDAARRTVDASAKVELTGLCALSFDGIAGLNTPADLQGAMKISTPSAKKLADFFGGGGSGNAAPALLDKPLTANALVSYGAGQASASSLHVTFGKDDFSGSLTGANLAPGTKAPLSLGITLAADRPVDLTPWAAGWSPAVPPAISTPTPAIAKGTPGDAAPAVPFRVMSAQITLLRPVEFALSLAAPSATYKETTLKGVSLMASYKAGQGSAIFKTDIPGGAVEADIDAAYTVGTDAKGGVTLTNSAYAYKLAGQTTDGAQALSAFLPASVQDTAKPLLRGPVALTASGDFKGGVMTLGDATLAAAGNSLHLTGSYTPARAAGGRDALNVSADSDLLDLDQLLLRLPTGDGVPVAPAPVAGQTVKIGATSVPVDTAKATGAALRNAARKLILPFDFDLQATAAKVRLKGTEYQKFSLLGALRGPALTLKTLQINDPDGDALVAAGTVGDLDAFKDVDLSMQGQTNNLKAILSGIDPQWKTAPDTLQAASLVAELKGDDAAATFTGNLRAMDGTLDVTGTVAKPLDAPALTDLTLRLRHPSFVDLARLVRRDFTANVAIKKAVDLFVTVHREKTLYTFTDLQGTIGPATFTGDVTADVGGTRPAVKARLQMTDVPLSDLIGHGGTGHAAVATVLPGSVNGGPAGLTAAANAPTSNATAPGRWSRDPVDIGWMRDVDVDLTASMRSLTYGSWRLDNGAVEATLKDGTLTLAKLDGGLYGGQMAMTGRLVAPEAQGGDLALSGTVDLQNVALDTFLDSFSASRVIDGRGVLSLKGDVDSKGGSPVALIGALSGKGTMTGKNILFNGFDLARFSRTLVSPGSSLRTDLSDFTGSLHGGSTAFNAADGTFTIAKGVVTLKPLTLTGDAANVSAPGTIDLPLWLVDMNATVQLVTPKDAPPLTVAIKGPLDQPAKAFGEDALKTYAAGRLKSLLSEALQKKGVAPAASGASGTKPKDLLKNVLKGLQKQ